LNIKQPGWSIMALLSSFLLGYISTGVAEMPSPLDVDQHPASPLYESLFSDRVVPLDTQLSWKRRFVGDESFNLEESLPSTSPGLEQISINTNSDTSEPMSDGFSLGGFDTAGVVKQVKLSEGKVKIKHGPIDRLGMPAMTMMFRVEDSTQLANLVKGAEVSFNVDNTAAGFSITQIEQLQASFDTAGVVKQVKQSEGKIKIKHGPIDRLGMPAMTMVFRVEDSSQLAGLVKGAEVAFNVDNTAAGFSITQIKKVEGEPGSSFDTQGTIKSIRASQGKVKIKHGPIERLGMPGMTMVFKVKNPEVLDALENDMQVEFDVINGAGGFVISRIKPMTAAASKTGSVVTDNRFCYVIGPFKKQVKALDIRDLYQGRGAITKLEASTERVFVGEMVYIDDLKTRAAALSTVQDLEARGISDTIILNESGKQNALSLGVFSLKQNALSLKSRAEAMDYSVKTEARYRVQTIYWLFSEQLNSAEPLDFLAPEDIESGVSQIPKNCKSGEGA
jgi:Cu/Ag efflux protein CusF